MSGERFGDIVGGLEGALRRVKAEEGRVGRINGPSRDLARQIARLKDWAAEQPEELMPTDTLHPNREEK